MITSGASLELLEDFKIYWEKIQLQELSQGYLNPEIDLIIDDMVDFSDQKKLFVYLNKWLTTKIINDLDSLFKLKSINTTDPNIRALAYQLYENNGIIKRDKILKVVKDLKQEERKILRDIGVKFGRYHIFLYKLFNCCCLIEDTYGKIFIKSSVI